MWPFGMSAKERLEQAIRDLHLTSELGLKVQVENKTAKVTGDVPSERYKDLIRAMASGINGIKDVNVSALNVDASKAAVSQTLDRPGSGARSGGLGAGDPTALAEAALAAIKKESRLADDPVDVLQDGTTVVLRGAVDSDAEFNLIGQIVMAVPGVTLVDDSGLKVFPHASQLNETDAGGDVVYTVKSGDTLAQIAQKFYGAAGGDSYQRIAEANDITDPDRLSIGQKLKIPGTPEGPEAVLR